MKALVHCCSHRGVQCLPTVKVVHLLYNHRKEHKYVSFRFFTETSARTVLHALDDVALCAWQQARDTSGPSRRKGQNCIHIDTFFKSVAMIALGQGELEGRDDDSKMVIRQEGARKMDQCVVEIS